MALNVWTKLSGYNFGYQPGANESVSSGSFIVGYEYVIQTVGTTDFKKVGSPFNSPGTVFRATNTGADAGPVITTLQNTNLTTPGTGVASRVAFSERSQLNLALPVQNDTGVNYKVISGKLPP